MTSTGKMMQDNFCRFIDKKIDALKEQYGTGVRPGWVSEEISFLRREKEMYKKSIATNFNGDDK